MLVLDKSGSMWSYHRSSRSRPQPVRQFVLSETSTAIGLVEFSSDARVLSIGGVNGLSFDADALMEVIDAMDSPSGGRTSARGSSLGGT